MPIKGIVLILLYAVIVAVSFHDEIYAAIRKFFGDKGDDE